MQSADEAINQAVSAAPITTEDPLRTTPLTCTIKMPGAVHVVECGHKFDPREQPRNNCGYCWGVYWRLHPAEVAAGASVINAYGKEPIIKSRGEKYFKALKNAVEAYEWQKQQEQLTKLTATPETESDIAGEAEGAETTVLPETQRNNKGQGQILPLQEQGEKQCSIEEPL